MSATFDELFENRNNNFDLIRTVAALLVLFSHCYPLTGRQFEPVAAYFGGYDTGGGWAVAVFFVISGFLVTRSVLLHTTVRYLAARALRILPALALVTVFELFVVGPLFTTEPLGSYFAFGKYRLLDITVFLAAPLPGIFTNNPVANEVNGSLWTLPIETFFYLLLPVMAAVGLLRRRALLIATAVIAIAYAVGVTRYGWNWNHQGGDLFVNVPAYPGLKNALFFLGGSLIWVYRRQLPANWPIALCLLGLLVIGAHTFASDAIMHIAVPYITIFAALARPIRWRTFERIGDLSYGTYVFAFPIQQAIVSVTGRNIGPLLLAIIATPIVLCVAAASWRFVERPALDLRRRLNRRENSLVGNVARSA